VSGPNSLDEHATTYVGSVQASVAACGEVHFHFVQLKADLMRPVLGAVWPRTFLGFGCGVGLSICVGALRTWL
jgi:hypothetical protein